MHSNFSISPESSVFVILLAALPNLGCGANDGTQAQTELDCTAEPEFGEVRHAHVEAISNRGNGESDEIAFVQRDRDHQEQVFDEYGYESEERSDHEQPQDTFNEEQNAVNIEGASFICIRSLMYIVQ